MESFVLSPRSVLSLAFLTALALATDDTANLETLRLTQVLFRHGDRNPLETFPSDPYKNQSLYWPQGLGQLTDIGKTQQFNLGRYLRRRYGDFISPTYVAGEIAVLSSDMDRTIMSAESNLAGFYLPPDDGTGNWNPSIPWTPVPFRTIPKLEDNLLSLKRPCPRFQELLIDFGKTDQFTNYINSVRDILDTIVRESGLPENAPLTKIMRVIDTLKVEAVHNLSLPDWAGNIYENMTAMVGYDFTFETATTELKRLRMGPFLKRLQENMEASIGSSTDSEAGSRSEKMYIFSGHDSTISGILDTLGVYNLMIPEYAVAVLFELHKDPQYSDYHVNIFYRNDTSRPPYELEIPNCGTPCFWETLVQITEPLIPENWDEECENVDKFAQASPAVKFAFISWTFFTILAICCLVAIFYVLFRQRDKSANAGTEFFKVSLGQGSPKTCYKTIQDP